MSQWKLVALTLGLQILLHRLEPDITQASRNKTPEEHGTLHANVLLLAKSTEYVLRESPNEGHNSIEQRQDKKTSLQENA